MKHLYRSRDRKIAGVCAGLAEYLEVDPVVMRLAVALTTLFFCCTPVLVYLIAWLIIPPAPEHRDSI